MNSFIKLNVVKILFLSLVAMISVFYFTDLKAAFTSSPSRYEIEINGKSFGYFDHVQAKEKSDTGIQEIQLSRNFVSEKSLSNWAEEKLQLREEECSVEFIVVQENRRQVYQVEDCLPLSWSIEEDQTLPGSLKESVTIAVQNILLKR